MQIRELLARDLSQRIAEVIQVDQADARSVHTELSEYVVTRRIREEYRGLLRAMADAPADPDEGVGVWISGFFGSGKSSFAKNLGYVLANREVLGERAADIFKRQVDDSQIDALIDSINARIPTDVIMFDVQKDRSQAGHGGLSISPFVYRVLLRELGYAEDVDLAELEISLEGDEKLGDFMDRYNRRFAGGDADSPNAWTRRGRKSAEVWNRVGVVLHELDPGLYPTVESFALKLVQGRVDVTPRLLVNRTFELAQRRRPGKTIAFIVDEVGQYVAYSQERLEDLRAVVELFGAESRNRVRSRQTPAPVWFIVTSQERLDEVTSAMSEDKRILIAKVRDRFRHEVDLSPEDIREVATRRVLAKRPAAEATLRTLYQDAQGQLNTACRLERTARRSEVSDDDFVAFYPYLPHYIDLCIDIMSGIRLQPGAMRHIGGSNRTIISQVYQMLVNPRTLFADQPVGRLVALDKVYELIEGQVGSARQQDINDIARAFKDDPADAGWTVRVAKAVCLLEFVRNLPRTESNVAALLLDEVGRPAPRVEVAAALKLLVDNQFLRDTEDGYKLQTAQEKDWDRERRDFLSPKPRDRAEIVRETVGEVFTDAKIKDFRYENKTFAVGLTVDRVRVGDDGPLSLSILVADGAENQAERFAEATDDSRQPNNQNAMYWAFPLDQAIDDSVADLYAGRQMVLKYDTLRAQGRITNEEATSLTEQKREVGLIATRLKERLQRAIAQGQGAFQGNVRNGPDLGKDLAEIFRAFYAFAVPPLYPKLDMGTRPVKGKGFEVEEVLKAANLNALPQVFYGGEGGLNLVTREGAKYLPNVSADIAREVLGYLQHEYSYGNKVTGKELGSHFGGIGYGWDLDIVQIVLAVLLRAGAIEITHQGRRFRNNQDPQCRVPLTTNTAFRAASFAPRKSIDIKTLTDAVSRYEDLTGDEVDVEEGAIAAAFKRFADDELRLALPVIATVRANGLPGLEALQDYQKTLQGVQDAASDDSVLILAGEGTALKDARGTVHRMQEAVSEHNLALLGRARTVRDVVWPALAARPEGADLAGEAEQLSKLTYSDTFYAQLKGIETLSKRISSTYEATYCGLHERRHEVFQAAVDEMQAQAGWLGVKVFQAADDEIGARAEELRGLDEVYRQAISPLTSRACVPGDPLEGGIVCPHCQATLNQMESDLAALPGLQVRVLERLRELAPLAKDEVPVERVRVLDFFDGPLDSKEAIETAVERLRAALLALWADKAQIILE